MPQPAPVPNDHPAVIDLHRAAYPKRLAEREAEGLASYGVRLQPFNTRDPLGDLGDELTDAQLYNEQAEYERDYVNGRIAALRTAILTAYTLNRAQIETLSEMLAEILTMNHWKGDE